MKKTIILLLLVIGAASFAHEFWIKPAKYIYKRGETINLKFLVGEKFAGENWSGNKEKVHTMHLYFADVVDSNLKDNLTDNKGDSIQFAIYEEGTAMVTLNTKNSFIDLEAKEFNKYLQEEGLIEALEYRREHGDTMKKGTERYQRSVKTIFQVGKNKNHVYKKRTVLPLDIIPDENPYAVAKDGKFKLRILFQGNALKKTKIKVWHRANNKVSAEDYETDNEGAVKIFLSLRGEWMVSCVKMVRLEDDPDAEWQSYWGSLTWGYY